MRTLKLIVQYEGTQYLGWQYQPNGVTIQQVIEDAIARVIGPHRIFSAGRTDAGVHALAQVVTLRTGKAIPAVELHRALNGILPPDIAVLSCDAVPNEFDPRRDAVRKLYRYRFFDRRIRPVFDRNFVWHVWNVDWDRLERGIPHLVGTHDFASFQGAGSNRQTKATKANARPKLARKTVRTIFRMELIRAADPLRASASGPPRGAAPAPHEVWLEVEGNGFLKQMVRNLVGSLMQVGRGFHEPEWIAEVLAAKDRSVAGVTAPASGLTLVRVEYAADAQEPPAG